MNLKDELRYQSPYIYEATEEILAPNSFTGRLCLLTTGMKNPESAEAILGGFLLRLPPAKFISDVTEDLNISSNSDLDSEEESSASGHQKEQQIIARLQLRQNQREKQPANISG